ncbi:MAG: DUF4388 domain-containing protein [Pyrinomonadaceae bacterium]
MVPKKDLEIRGNLLTHPFAEVLAEIAHAELSGSLRVSASEKKTVVYFRAGRLVFAASNARSCRLYELVLAKGKVDRSELSRLPDVSNDFELSAYLQERGVLTKEGVEDLFKEQISAIVSDALSWHDGEWTFSHLARARDGLDFKIKTDELLVRYSRSLTPDAVLKRFRSLDEKFERSAVPMNGLVLSPVEAFVLSRAEEGELTAAEMASVAAMPGTSALQVMYTLWLAGLLDRTQWSSAFSDEKIAAIRGAKLELKREATIPSFTPIEQREKPAAPSEPAPQELTITLDEYLDRVENAATYYDIFDVQTDESVAEIKRAYFALAKMFHPDKYHSVEDELRKRVQRAFTELSQAHETLKDTDQRELYDYRMRKEIAVRAKAVQSGQTVDQSQQLMQAAECFDRGLTLLMDNEADDALPLLARAVHYAPNNARYHAYYGKALSADHGKRHKAEAELQAALKIDPENATFRLMLAQFFIEMGLKKRAEGELNRLLAVSPSNREAQDMLAGLKNS